MIGKIKGILSEIDGQMGLIETSGGVFYRVFLPPPLLRIVTPESIEIYTYLQVRDDAFVLFGFETKVNYDYFNLLLTVSGVGPKTAFNVMAYAQPVDINQAVRNNDVKFFSKVPGLGKKTAMKIILELSQKLKEEFHMEKMNISEDDSLVVDALVSLGFKRQEAGKVLDKIDTTLSVEDKIREAIKITTGKNKPS